MRELPIHSESSDLIMIWIVDLTDLWNFVYRDLEVKRTLNMRNAETRLKGKNNKCHPTVRINLDCDRRATVLSCS
jgi:hypothetical protein